jgi:hypothetical protein
MFDDLDYNYRSKSDVLNRDLQNGPSSGFGGTGTGKSNFADAKNHS